MRADEVIALLKQAKVKEAIDALDSVNDRLEMAHKLSEFAGALNHLKGLPILTEVLLRRSLMLDPDNPYTHYNLGLLYSGLDMLQEDESNLNKALLAFKNAIRIKPDFHQARYDLALLYYFSGMRLEAASEYETILKAVGDDVGYRDLGMMLLADKRLG
jgi:tetratricopeptide (TPR) repeat protein